MTKVKIDNYKKNNYTVQVRNHCYYCRGLHGVLPEEIQYCNSCPIAANLEQEDIKRRTCAYYDMEHEEQIGELTPKEMYEYYEQHINQQNIPIFPKYKKVQTDLIEKAYQFAAMAHKGTYRKGTRIPYISHLMETAQIVSTMSKDEDVIAAALLHDVVEDTIYTIGDIQREFGDRIAGFVAAESEDKMTHLPASETWYIRKKNFLDHIQEQCREVQLIALSDKLSNMRSTARDYKEIGDKLWERFHQKDKELHKWYYLGVGDRLSHLSNLKPWKEYKRLCAKVFLENE